MKTGDTVHDPQGAAWQFGPLLGRGLWGKTWSVRRDGDDTPFVLKAPLGPEDFKGEVPGADALFAACREAALEQARLYADARAPFLPRLEARLALPDGTPAYVIPAFSDSLERRMAEGVSVSAALEAVVAVGRLLRQLPEARHGALRPADVLFNERGEIFLTDLATPAVQRNLPRLLAATPALAAAWPPEVAESGGPWSPVVDTWACAMILWRAALLGQPLPNPPRAGLDKGAQVTLKDRLQDRLKQEDSNPRFHGRVAERYAVLLARALSREATPSPPYRFPALDEFVSRVDEVHQLIRPQVTTVGKVMLDRPASRPSFDTTEPVAFSCTVGCTLGVEGPEEIGVGIAVFDIDRDLRLKDLDLGYTVDRHPGSGPGASRYRFLFRIGGVNPGHFRVRLAFAIRDSGQTPATTEAELVVVPAPGWVPPPEEAPAQALSFAREPESPTRPGGPSATQPGGPGATQPGGPGVTQPGPSGGAPPVRRVPVASPGGPPPTGSTEPRPVPRATEPAKPAAPAPAPRLGDGPSRPIPTRPEPVRAASPGPTAAGTVSPGAAIAPGPRPDAPPVARVATTVAEPPSEASEAPTTARPTAPVVRRISAPLAGGGGASSGPRPLPTLAPAQVDLEEDEEAEAPTTVDAPPRPAAPIATAPPNLRVQLEEEEAPVPEPRRRGAWTEEPLPTAPPGRAAPVEEEPEEEVSDEPGLVERVIQQMRTDPYIAVMAGLGAVTLILLVVFLLIRK